MKYARDSTGPRGAGRHETRAACEAWRSIDRLRSTFGFCGGNSMPGGQETLLYKLRSSQGGDRPC